MINFPNDILNLIFSYINSAELNTCCLVCRKWNFLINNYQWKIKLLNKLNSKKIKKDLNITFKQLYYFTIQLPSTFLTLDYSMFNSLPNFNNNQFELNQRIEIIDKCIYFKGELIGGDRTITSNKPILNTIFNFPIVDDNNIFLTLSNTYYFEITVGNLPHRQSWENECISIGFGNKYFPLIGSQLGWSYNSVGFHSDDGKFYNNTGFGKYYSKPWGKGDTVGCGIILNKGYRVFYTLNGKFLGFRKFKFDNNSSIYAMLGIDSSYPIKVNMGKDQFCFNIGNFIKDYLNLNKINLKREYNKVKKLVKEEESIYYDEDGFVQAFLDILNITLNV